MVFTDKLQAAGVDERFISAMNRWNGDYFVLRAQTRRERIDCARLAPSRITPKKLRPMDHIGYWGTDFGLPGWPARPGAQYWVSGLLDHTTIVIARPDDVEQIRMCAIGLREGLPATSNMTVEELHQHVLEYENVLAAYKNNEYCELLKTVKRVVVFGCKPTRLKLHRISNWSRSMDQIPELLISN